MKWNYFFIIYFKKFAYFSFFPHRPIGQKQKYRLISELNRQSFVYFMLSTGLFDTSLCVKFYGFVLKIKFFIRIFFFKMVGLSHFSFLQLNDWSITIWKAFRKRYVILFKNIFEFLVLCVHCKVLTPNVNVTIFFLITKIYVEIDTLVLFALFLLSKCSRGIMLSSSN